MNPLQSLYDQCNGGHAVGKYARLADGPIMVDLEPVGLCNFRCTMCPTGLNALGRPSGFMTAETHQAVLEKTAPYNSAIRYIGFGEPLMHPKIVKFVEDATTAGRLTHINTNASNLTPALTTKLIEAGLSSLKFSFQGTDRETYAAMRRVDFFDQMLQIIAMTRETRDHLGSDLWIAASTSTTDETPEMIGAFRERVEPLVDQLSIGSTIFEYIDMDAVPEKQRPRLEKAAATSTVVKKHPEPCTEIYDKLTIHHNGAVRVCCNDFSGKTNLGDISQDEFAGIWRHKTIDGYRKSVAQGKYEGPLCSVCWDYMDLTG